MKRFFAFMLCALLLFAMMGGSTAMGETIYFGNSDGEAWYEEMLQRGILNLGNNTRLKNVISRALSGETITVALIGGSITEGAGASKYADCYASRVAQGFARCYGAGDGKNVHFLNAGVGGTPSTFGLMRYDRDVTKRVQDDDGLADLVIVEFAVNDYGEPTRHRAYESLVKTILSQENNPAVILLFSVFENGFNLQGELRAIGQVYDLMMVSIKDAAYPNVDKKWTKKEFFHDEYHPTSLGHGVMADCVLYAIGQAYRAEESKGDVNLDAEPAYGVDYMGLQTIYGDSDLSSLSFDRGSFSKDDTQSYTNYPVGRVCGKNFFHDGTAGNDPLAFQASFKKLLIAWRAVSDQRYGAAEVLVDGKLKAVLKGGEGKWGQSEVAMLWDAKEPREHTVEIRMQEGSENLRFTITAIGIAE